MPGKAGRHSRLGWLYATQPLPCTHFYLARFGVLTPNPLISNRFNKRKSLPHTTFRAWMKNSIQTVTVRHKDRKNLFPRMLAVKNAVPGRNMLFTRIFLPHLGIRWFHNILSFESGAMVKVLGLDDSEWKDVPYYPYDLVHDGNRK